LNVAFVATLPRPSGRILVKKATSMSGESDDDERTTTVDLEPQPKSPWRAVDGAVVRRILVAPTAIDSCRYGARLEDGKRTSRASTARVIGTSGHFEFSRHSGAFNESRA
jgi:hypothetical protein